MRKPIDLSIKFKPPKDSKVSRAYISSDGTLHLHDEKGIEVVPDELERVVSYKRSGKGPKVQAKSTIKNGNLSVNGLEELIKFESVFAIDTNTQSYDGRRLSVTAFMAFKFLPDLQGVRVEHEKSLNIYEFWGIPEEQNPEKLAILKVANDIVRSAGKQQPNICIITDCDLQSHDLVNEREIPIYKKNYLPTGFMIHYASTDTGSEAINKLIRFCDSQSKAYIKYLKSGEIKHSDLKVLEEETAVQYRYMFRTDVDLVNPVVKGISIQPGTKAVLYGIKD